jgi:hypothetical protein
MDSKESFFETIFNYYSRMSNGKIPNDILIDISKLICNYFFEQYSTFRIQYPKSVKRYSSFLIKDLNHPQPFEIIINYLKNKFGINYNFYSTILLDLTQSELKDFEKNRKEYHNK